MVRLSASKLDTLKKCSFLYYCKYVLRIADEAGLGAGRGSVTHSIIEPLLRPDRRKYVDQIIKTKDAFCVPSIERLIRKYSNKYGVSEDDHIDKIKKYLMVALSFDFYCEGSLSLTAEEKFEIDEGKYILNGKIDRTAIYEDRVCVADFKTSKQKFNKEDLDFNIQALMYALVQRKKHPNLPIEVDFIFLKCPKKPIQKTVITDALLDGFVEWLDYIVEYIEDYDYKKGISDMAASGWPRRAWCGSELGEVDKEGNPKYICSFKYPALYYSAYDGEKLIKTSRNRQDLEYLSKSGCRVEMKQFEGCPSWQHLWRDKK